jgi:hypothetical protein
VAETMCAGKRGEWWLAFCRSVEELNAFRRPRVLRTYQADLLGCGSFAVVSPDTGNKVSVQRSVMLADRIAYLIPGETRSWLVTGPTRFGYPLWEFITETDNSRRLLSNPDTLPTELSRLEKEKLGMLQTEQDGMLARRATLLIGDANFAHHLWNELAGLDEWLASTGDEDLSGLSVAARAEPLGPLEWIFPRLSAASLLSAGGHEFHARLHRAPIVTRIGSSLVTSRLRHRIKAISQEHASPTATHLARQILQDSWPRVWMSVRLGSRTADNLEDFLFETVCQLLLSYPDAAVIFDGFSFPYAFFEDPRTTSMRKEFADRAEAVSSFIEQLREKVRRELGEAASSKLCSVSGQSLFDAIDLGGYCDYYVCHAGTLQHKIAWIHNIPGLIHLPLNTASRAVWHAAQVEDGIVPDMLPQGLSVPTDPPASGRSHDRNFNYRISDVKRAAECVVSFMQLHLTRPALDR